MSKLEIPEAAYEAGENASAQLNFRIASPRRQLDTAVEAAAPLIVAAELRKLADVLSVRCQEMREEDGRGIRSSGLSVAVIHLRARADELDG